MNAPAPLDLFIQEAHNIVAHYGFTGPADGLMLWGGTENCLIGCNGVVNQILCDVFRASSGEDLYMMSDIEAFDAIMAYQGSIKNPLTAIQAWNIFSRALVKRAAGTMVTIAGNNTREGDWLRTAEIPALKERGFTHVRSLEPNHHDRRGSQPVIMTEWRFNDWLMAQEEQWRRPDHYLDGTPYPSFSQGAGASTNTTSIRCTAG